MSSAEGTGIAVTFSCCNKGAVSKLCSVDVTYKAHFDSFVDVASVSACKKSCFLSTGAILKQFRWLLLAHILTLEIQQWIWAPASSLQDMYWIITMPQIIWMEELVLRWTEHPTNRELADRKGKLREVLHWDVKNIILGCFTMDSYELQLVKTCKHWSLV